MTVKALEKAVLTVLELRPLLISYLRIVGFASFVVLQVAWSTLIVYLFVGLIS